MPARLPTPFPGRGEPTGSGAGEWRAVRRLLVVRADNIGDVLIAGPAMRALKAGLPGASLTLLASPAGAAAAPLLTCIDAVIRWRVLWQDLGRLPFDPRREWSLVRRLARNRFDGAVILTSFSQTPHAAAFAACLAGIPLRAGSSRVTSGLLTHEIPHGGDAMHQVERNLALVEALGFPVADRSLSYRTPPSSAAHAATLLEASGIDRGAPYLLYSPFSSAHARTYPPSLGAEALRRMSHATRMPVVLSGHTRDKAAIAEVAQTIGSRAVNLAGATGVCELAALVERATLVVTGNTSAMHMADAAARPTLALYSGSDLESQWEPRRASHRMLRRPTPCSPCYAIECPYGRECLDIPPAEVAEAGLELLAMEGVRHAS